VRRDSEQAAQEQPQGPAVDLYAVNCLQSVIDITFLSTYLTVRRL